MAWREHLGKAGGGLMATAFVSAVGYLITSHATGEPSPHLKLPVWPYYLLGAMFVVGFIVYGAAHGILPWQKYRALKRRAETAEPDLLRTEHERDEARRELADVKRAAIAPSAAPGLQALELDLSTGKLPGGDWITRHYLGVKLPADQPERRVYVTQSRIQPEPRHPYPYSPRPAFPYSVPPRGGGDGGAGVIIQPGQAESWVIGDTATGGDGTLPAGSSDPARADRRGPVRAGDAAPVDQRSRAGVRRGPHHGRQGPAPPGFGRPR